MPEPTRPMVIERQITTDLARDRVARALYEVAIDGVGYGARDVPTTSDRDWIRGAMAVPIQEATEEALHDLAQRLGHALERAPGGLLTRYEASHAGQEVGSE